MSRSSSSSAESEKGKTPAAVAKLMRVDRTTLWRAMKRREATTAA